MNEYTSLTISILALLVSLFLVWKTHFQKGKLKITRPNLLAFAYDYDEAQEGWIPKIFLRGLLFSSSEQGHVVLNLYVKLRGTHNELSYPVWGYGENELLRGSGINVPRNGIVTNHHFLMSKVSDFRFKEEKYQLDLFAELSGHRRPIKLLTLDLQPSESFAEDGLSTDGVIWFDWDSEKAKYNTRQESKPPSVIITPKGFKVREKPKTLKQSLEL